jgi:hypothetical protein
VEVHRLWEAGGFVNSAGSYPLFQGINRPCLLLSRYLFQSLNGCGQDPITLLPPMPIMNGKENNLLPFKCSYFEALFLCYIVNPIFLSATNDLFCADKNILNKADEPRLCSAA